MNILMVIALINLVLTGIATGAAGVEICAALFSAIATLFLLAHSPTAQ